MTTILIVGGADTGRAPMAAALLRRHLTKQHIDWHVGSAGVLGHDGDGPETEARDAMTALGLDVADHRARSVSDALVAGATLLVAVDNGTTLVLRERFPDAAPRIYVLGDLAGKQRDIPDPFRMQIGAWIGYARELDGLIEAALPRMSELLATTDHRPPTTDAANRRTAELQKGAPARPAEVGTVQRIEMVKQLDRLLHVAAELPDVIRWDAARAHIESGLATAATPMSGDDLALAYVGVLRAALTLGANPPTAGQLVALREAVGALRGAVGQVEVAALSARLAGWATI